MAEETLLRSIVMDIKRRDTTDVRIYPFLIAAVVFAFVATAIVGFLTNVGQSNEDRAYYLIGVTIVTVGILLSLMYLLIGRNYKHAKRDADLAMHMCTLAQQLEAEGRFVGEKRLRKMAGSIPSVRLQKTFFIVFAVALIPALAGTCYLVMEGPDTETINAANVMYAVSLGITALSLLLNIGFPKKHENEFMRFTDMFCDGVREAGYDAPRYQPVIGIRNGLLMLLLTLVTLFLFFPVWIYLSMRDMNRHLDQQWAYEEDLVRFLEDL